MQISYKWQSGELTYFVDHRGRSIMSHRWKEEEKINEIMYTQIICKTTTKQKTCSISG